MNGHGGLEARGLRVTTATKGLGNQRNVRGVIAATPQAVVEKALALLPSQADAAKALGQNFSDLRGQGPGDAGGSQAPGLWHLDHKLVNRI